MQIDQRFVDLQAVFYEGNLQFFGVQAAAQGFQGFASFLIGREGSGAIAAGLGELAAEEVRLVSENGSLEAGDLGDGRVCFRLRGGKFSDLQRDAREQKMRESGFAGKRRLIEEFGRAGAEPAGFEVAAFVEEKEALIEVEEPGPDEIFFGGEHGASFCEAFECVDGFSLLAVGDGFVGQSFRGFVAHAEFFESEGNLRGPFRGLLRSGSVRDRFPRDRDGRERDDRRRR